MRPRVSPVRLATASAICLAILAIGCRLPGSSSPLDPPTWIHGTWSDAAAITTWVFTTDDVLWTTGTTTLDFREMQSRSLRVSDSETSTTYTVSMSGGGVTETYRFVKVDQASIRWVDLSLVLLKVTPVIAVQGVDLDVTSASLDIGESLLLTAKIIPPDATDRSVTWQSGNGLIATVDPYGRVTAHAAGTTTVSVRTSDGGNTAACTVTVSSLLAPPGYPDPADGSVTNDTTPLLGWEPATGAAGYRVQIGTSAGFDTLLVDDDGLAGADYQVASLLVDDTTYHWRVKTKNDGSEWGDWSSGWTFRVDIEPPAVPSPVDGSTVADCTPMLDWEDIPGTSAYRLQLATEASFSAPLLDENIASSHCEVTTALANHATYFWRVQTRNADDVWGDWSGAWCFTVEDKWSVTVGGSDDDYLMGIRALPDGGCEAVGMTESYGAGWADFMVARIAADGALVWARCYGGSGYDHPFALRSTSDGGSILVGHSGSFGTGTKCWVVKLSADGSIAWQKAYGGSIADHATDIRQTADGGYIVAGYTQSFAPTGTTNALLFKLTSTGAVEWAKAYGGLAGVSASTRSVRQVSDGGYVVSGQVQMTPSSWPDAHVMRIASDGSIVWQKRYGGSGSASDTAQSILETPAGEMIMAGATASFGAGNYDIWLLKLTTDGAVIWQMAIGGPADDLIDDGNSDLLMLSDGSYLVCGSTLSSGAGAWDACLLSFDSDGAIHSGMTYGTSGNDVGQCIERTPEGRTLVAGDSPSGAPGRNFWIMRLDDENRCGPYGTIAPFTTTISSASIADTLLLGSNCSISEISTTGSVTNVSPGWFRQVP